MTRDEHMAWAKGRALEYVERGELLNAVTSMASDLSKHDEIKAHPALALLGGMYAVDGDAAAVRRWIDGFR